MAAPPISTDPPLHLLPYVTEFVGDSAETLSLISRDLKDFIQLDSGQIPCSLKQHLKLTKSDEASESIVMVTRALTMGISRGFQIQPHSGSSLPNQALDKLFSPAGAGFVSVVVGSFSRNMVMVIYDDTSSGNQVDKWVDVITYDKFRNLIGDCIHGCYQTL